MGPRRPPPPQIPRTHPSPLLEGPGWGGGAEAPFTAKTSPLFGENALFSCIRAGANTGATCIRPEIISLRNLANMQKMTPQKYFPVFARVRIQAPHVFAEKLIPQDFFPACIGFVPGGTSGSEGT